MGTKIIHLQFKDGREDADAYFGSIPAIYQKYSSEDLGIKMLSLANVIAGKKNYENKKISIKISEMIHSPKTKSNK